MATTTGYIDFTEQTTPATPSASHQRVFIDSTTHVLKYVNSSGTASNVATGGAAGALVFLEAHTATNAGTSLDFTSFISSTYDTYKIEGTSIVLATSTAELRIVVGTGGGPTYDTGNFYEWGFNGITSGGSGVTDSGSSGLARIFKATSVAANYGFGSFSLTLSDPQSTTLRRTIRGDVQYVNSTGPAAWYGLFGMQYTQPGTALTALRFITSSGNIVSGTIRIYGVAKS